MAQEAIATCRQSLVSATQLLATQSSEIDARLFLVRHLLVLKEITGVVNATESQAAAGFAGYEQPQQDVFATTTGERCNLYEVPMTQRTSKDTLGALLRGTSSLFGGSALLGGLSTYAGTNKVSAPKVVSYPIS